MSAKIKKTPNDRHDAAIAIAFDNLKRTRNEEGTVANYVTNYLVLILWMMDMNAEEIFTHITNKIGKCPISLARIIALIRNFEKKLPKKDPDVPMN